MGHGTKRALVAGLLAALTGVGGCAFSRPIAMDAVAYNEDLATAQNEVLLLNIARASLKHPLFFSSVNSISRSLTSKVGGPVEIPFGNAAQQLNVSKIGAEIGGGPTATIGILDSEKFMRGITKPIDPETFAYYWNQGWPREILLELFVRRVEINGRVLHGHMFPEAGETAQQVVANYLRYHRDLVEELGGYKTIEVVPIPYPVKVDVDKITTSELISVAKEGLTLVKAPDGSYGLVGKSVDKQVLFKDHKDGREGKSFGTGDAGKFHMRSVEAMIYHLGEIVRMERSLPPGKVPLVVFDEKPVPFFSARGAGACPSDCAVSVCYCGQRLTVAPSPESGESMHVLSLVSQLLAMHKSADELPKGGVVTLVAGN
jgi:hypothetical protein